MNTLMNVMGNGNELVVRLMQKKTNGWMDGWDR